MAGPVKSVLISQPKPETEKSPYFDISKKYKVKIDFRPFIHVEGLDVKEFRKERVNLSDFTAIIFTSKNAVDHFFRIAEETRYQAPDTLKYFCVSEAIAFYLQKYVVYRKRKIFYGKQGLSDLMDSIKKYKDEKFLLPCADKLTDSVPELLKEANINFTPTILYKTVCSDLSDLKDIKYDVLVFFSPSGIKSLFQNFPDFQQNGTRIAVFGPTTAKAAEDAGLKINIQAPMPESPSMSMALENYIKST